MTRKRCTRKFKPALPPRGLRPKLSAEQVRDLSLIHVVNLDAMARGEAGEAILWDWVAGIMTWSKVAELLQIGVEEMDEQSDLTKRVVDRYARTGRVGFDGPDYQLAKVGVDVMDQLAERVDLITAGAAADWSERKVAEMSQMSKKENEQ